MSLFGQFNAVASTGDFTEIQSTNTVVNDAILQLGNGNNVDSGLILNQSTNKAIIWDNSESQFSVCTTSNTGLDATITPSAYSDFRCKTITCENVNATSNSPVVINSGSNNTPLILRNNDDAAGWDFKIPSTNSLEISDSGGGTVLIYDASTGISIGHNANTQKITVGDIVITNGSITSTSSAISFGDENLTTTGTLTAGVATLATGSTIGNLTLANGSITDSSGSISFNDENLTTSGELDVGNLTFNTNTISTSAGNVIIHPVSGSGISMDCGAGGDIQIQNGGGGDIILNPDGGGDVLMSKLNVADGTIDFPNEGGQIDFGTGTIYSNNQIRQSTDSMIIDANQWIRLRHQGSNIASFGNGNQGHYFHQYTGGTLNVHATTKQIQNVSDRRLKEDEEKIPYGLKEINQLLPKKFKWKNDDRRDLGFIADELETVIPESVDGKKYHYMYETEDDDITPKFDENGDIIYKQPLEPRYRGVYDRAILAVCVKSIQELSTKNDTLEARITALEARLLGLEKK